MMRLFLLVFVLIVVSTNHICAQNDSFEQMKNNLNSNSLPLVNLTVDLSLMNNKDFLDGEIEICDYQRRTEPSSQNVKYHCKLRYRGASALKYEKKSFAVKLFDKDGEDLDANIFGIRNENDWILDAMSIDRIRMRNRVCFDLWNQMSKTPYETNYDGRNGTKGEFVEVFVNSIYHGLYCMTDKIDRKLLNLKKIRTNGDVVISIRGLLYKGTSWGSASDLLTYEISDVSKEKWNAWELKYPDDYPSAETWQPMMDLIDFCSDKTDEDTYKKDWEKHFYKDNLVDYMVFTLALNVRDNGYKNMYISTPNINKGQCFMITPWDMDASLGGNWNGNRLESTSHINRYNNIAPYNRVYVNDMTRFRHRLKEVWKLHKNTVFSQANVEKLLDRYAETFLKSGAWKREYNKWNEKPVPLEESPLEELKYVKNWYQKNYIHLDKALDQLTETARFLGDVNYDDNVDISDIVAVLNVIASANTYVPVADVNKDNNIDISDIVAIINIIAIGSEFVQSNQTAGDFKYDKSISLF